jgi:hypothetical protein
MACQQAWELQKSRCGSERQPLAVAAAVVVVVGVVVVVVRIALQVT